ncbi:ferrous iron transport protein A [Venenivibrio stagnispumantis]|uniref:Ferrous iron transport protein A n=1 Tax=Venenivibrio stagnispumantis TaxID=407998 RepID=A0AA45WLN2_9AQUI|nr:FeoA family protein [Venenivibrio stagnispumantis]MCW4573273.1 ferrous iron transport protein A [Venenivibrio stagnispumantis]SMP11441.1 ferrous iron transport protein A [Venenivibrio stagnispumantis]
MKLSELKVGEFGKITNVKGKNPDIKRRLREMGLIKGEILKVEKIAPLGDPIEVNVKGYKLSLRKEEANYIEVEKN